MSEEREATGSVYTPCVSELEYLKLEETAREKHEYVAGRAFAMVGASAAHNTLVMNLARHLYDPVRQAGRSVFASDMKVKIATLQRFYYPDLIVTCEKLNSSAVFVTAPRLIVEVLSPSTKTVDQREKLQAYRSIATLEEYVLVHQDKMRVEIYRKDEVGDWQYFECNENSMVSLSSVPGGTLQLEMQELFRGIDFDLPA